jgi:hypothetical protein
VYRANRVDQLLAVGGTFGLAALSPPKGTFPASLAVIVIMLPMVLFELGAAIHDGSSTLRGHVVGARVQILGAVAYFVVCTFAIAAGTGHPGDIAVDYPLAACGLFLAARVWRDACVLSREPVPHAVARRRK